MKKLELQAFYDESTATLTYVVWDSVTHDAVVIDPVLDFDPATQLTSTKSVKKLIEFVHAKELSLHWVLETHAHADHLSAAREICAAIPGCQWGMSARMVEVFDNFKKVFSWPASSVIGNLGVARWLKDGEEISAGSMRIQALATPGHTPACMTFKIDEWLFTGDALFMPDSGVGRCDFPGGSAEQLYHSVWGKIYSMPDHYRIYVGHDYKPKGRPLQFQTTVGEEKSSNIHLQGGTNKADFISFREGRDKTLSAPRLLAPSLDWNLGAHQVVKR
jgi:glyoxylase-like metal-dependent hydrolase (beta-lactamase superfamily II)